MPVFHSKPAEILAWLYDGSKEGRDQLLVLLGEEGRVEMGVDHLTPHLLVRTANGWVEVHPAHYLIKGVRDFYPCDPITFVSRWVEGPIPHRGLSDY